MKKKSSFPQTKVKNPEPKKKDENWIIWAAWADRITFEEIKEKTGKSESDVIKIMRKNLKPGSFRLWRKRVHNTSIKHRKKFKLERKKMKDFLSIEKNRPSPNPTNYTYSCSARRDESNGITFRQFGDGRLFSKILLSIETQSQLPPGEEPAVSGLSRRPSPNTLKVPPFDSS